MNRLFFPIVALLCLIIVVPDFAIGESPVSEIDAVVTDAPMSDHWEPCVFGGDGPIEIGPEAISLSFGDPLSGVYWTGEYPRENYRWSWEAKRTQGFDFFAAGTFPIGDGFATFVPGGWGGGVVGLSNINGDDASANETTQYVPFESDQWYRFVVEVDDKRVRCWIDDSMVIDVERGDKKFTLRSEMDLCRPFGIASFQSDAELRNIQLRRLPVTESPIDVLPSSQIDASADSAVNDTDG